jgi:hypothetical protein
MAEAPPVRAGPLLLPKRKPGCLSGVSAVA